MMIGIAIGAVSMLLAQAGWRWVKKWRIAAMDRRLEALSKIYGRKLFRHAPSGRVGLCIGGAMQQRGWLGSLFCREVLIVVPCPACALAVQQAGPFGVMAAHQAGHVATWRLGDVRAALECEREAFRAAGKEHQG